MGGTTMNSYTKKKITEIHLYREDGRDVWCNQANDGYFYDNKGNRFVNLKPTLYQDVTGEFLYCS